MTFLRTPGCFAVLPAFSLLLSLLAVPKSTPLRNVELRSPTPTIPHTIEEAAGILFSTIGGFVCTAYLQSGYFEVTTEASRTRSELQFVDKPPSPVRTTVFEKLIPRIWPRLPVMTSRPRLRHCWVRPAQQLQRRLWTPMLRQDLCAAATNPCRLAGPRSGSTVL